MLFGNSGHDELKKKWFFDLLSSQSENELFMLFDDSEKARGCLISCLKAHSDDEK